MSYSVRQIAYGLPWDGCTVLIDRETIVTGQVTSVPLAMQSLAERIVDYIRGKGPLLHGQQPGPHPHDDAQADCALCRVDGPSQPWPARTWAVRWARQPCAGHAPRERPPRARASQARRALLRALLLPRARTVELHLGDVPHHPGAARSGICAGTERIHTTVSGRFGFPTERRRRIHVVNAGVANGWEVGDGEDGARGRKRLYEIRMPGDHFAVLVRREK